MMHLSTIGRMIPVRVVLLGLVIWLATGQSAVGGDSGISLPDDPLAGRLIFQNKGCVRCHGLPGSGLRIGPDLGEGSFGGSFFDLGAALWNHVPGMSVTFEIAGLPWPTVSQGETTELLAFLYFIEYLGRPGRADLGEIVFHSQGCDSCHGMGGGAVGVGPDLADLEQFASPLFVAQQIWNHGPVMLESMRERGIRAPTFEDGDLADLSAYIRQRATAGPQARLFLAPGNPNQGREVFVAKGCKTCHGGGGRGGEQGPDLVDADLHRSAESVAATMWNHGLAMEDAMRRAGVGWPTFGDSELADLIAFLYFLPFADSPGDPDRGASVFQERACSTCHGKAIAGTGSQNTGPALTGEAAMSPPAFLAAMWTHAPVMKRAILREGLPWPELSGDDLRDLRSFLEVHSETP